MHPGRSDNSCYARNPDGNCPTLTKACCDKGFVDNNDGRGCVKECGICPCFDIEYLTSLKLDSKSICTSETDLFGLLPKPISVFALLEPDFADFIVACSGPLCTNESFEVNSCGAVVLPEHFDGSWDQFETAELENIAIESISQTQQDACVCLIEQAAEMAGIECSGDLLDAVPDDFSG